MLENLRNYIDTHVLFQKKTPILVACSGGMDSMCLLSLLMEGKFENISVAHCNFGLRAEASDGDETFVKAFCEKHQLPFYSVRFDTAEFANAHQLSTQMAARQLRYEWLEKVRKETGAHLIVTAHHADDQAETILFNIIQGTGIRGLKGMLPKQGVIVRPMLEIERTAIKEYVLSNQIAFREDSSNASTKYRRNFIRHEIMPLLTQLNPAVQQTLGAFARKMKESEILMQQEVERIRKKTLLPWKIGYKLLTTYLQEHPASSTLFYEILNPFGFSADQVKEMMDTISGIKSNSLSGQQFLSTSHQIFADKKALYILPLESEKTEILRFEKWPGQIIFNEYKIDVRQQPIHEVNMQRNARYAYLDADLVKFPITIRYAQTADYFYPLGMGKAKNSEKPGKKKLSKFFKDIKLPLAERAFTPVIFGGEALLWVLGHRTDDRFKISESTKNVICLVITKQ
jgi:tRNA(Ile)-lysidine synthase